MKFVDGIISRIIADFAGSVREIFVFLRNISVVPISRMIKYFFFRPENRKKLMKHNKSLYKKIAKKIKKKRPKRKKKVTKKYAVTRSFIAGILFTMFFVFIPVEFIKWYRLLPSPKMLVTESLSHKSTKIFDRNGKLLYEIYVDRRYSPVELAQIPDHVLKATIAVEDDQFYEHRGIRFDSIVRAAKKTVFERDLQGGSTITQQLVKNVLLTPERTVSRKIKEAVLAIVADFQYSKDQILEMYMNNIPYGGTAWGVQPAAQKFFGKNVWELSLSEASLLAGLPSAPSTYSPITDFDLAKNRQKYVLDRMVELNYISRNQAEEAYEEELEFVEQKDYIRAPHFVDYVRKELERKYGKRMVEYGGLTVLTTLDLDLHDQVQQIVSEEVIKAERINLSNGGAVVLDVKNAEILAYVGSVDYYKEEWGAYDIITAYRQPGSAIKPVTYSLALSTNYTPASIIKDTRVTFRIEGAKPYTPLNYDGKYHGNVTLREALANSYNVPAVRVANTLGPDNIVALGKELGLSNWEVDGNYGLSITLGGKEVRLLDITNMYATLGRYGTYMEVTPFTSVKDSRGYEIYKNEEKISRKVIDDGVAYLMWHILSDNQARIPAFGQGSSLVIPNNKIAVKTGTTDDKRDNWTIGYTPSYAVGVWVGNNDNTPMNRYLASGLSGAAPIWNRIFRTVLEDKPDEQLEMPSSVFVKFDEACGNRSEVFVKGSNVPKSLCFDRDKDDKDNDNDND